MNSSWNKTKKVCGLLACLLAWPGLAGAQSSDAVQKQIQSKGGLLSGMSSKLQASESQRAALKAEIEVKQKELQAALALVANLKATLSENQNKVVILSTQDAVQKDQIAEAEVALEDSAGKLSVLLEKEKQLIAVQAQAGASKAMLDGMNSKVQEQDGTIVALRNQLAAATQDLGSAGGKIGTMEKDLGENGSEINELKADLDQAIYTTREREAEISRLRSDVAKAVSSARVHQASVKNLELHRMVLGGALGFAILCLIFALRRRR